MTWKAVREGAPSLSVATVALVYTPKLQGQ